MIYLLTDCLIYAVTVFLFSFLQSQYLSLLFLDLHCIFTYNQGRRLNILHRGAGGGQKTLEGWQNSRVQGHYKWND